MEPAIQVFEPLKNQAGTIALLLLTFIALGVVLWRQLNNKSMERNRRMVLAMLVFFAFIIGLFSAAGMAINTMKFRTVTVYESGISIGKKQIPFREMRGYLIREDRSQSWVNPDMVKKTVRSLVIEEKTGKTYLLPEEYYELPRLIAALDSAYEKWKAQ